MAMRDLVNRVGVAVSIGPAASTATVNGTGFDVRPYGSAMAVLCIGAVTGTSPTATVRLEESDDDITYTAVAAADIDGGVALGIGASGSFALVVGSANTVKKIGYLGTKRYIRWAQTTIGGTGTPTFNLLGFFVGGKPALQPVP